MVSLRGTTDSFQAVLRVPFSEYQPVSQPLGPIVNTGHQSETDGSPIICFLQDVLIAKRSRLKAEPTQRG